MIRLLMEREKADLAEELEALQEAIEKFLTGMERSWQTSPFLLGDRQQYVQRPAPPKLSPAGYLTSGVV